MKLSDKILEDFTDSIVEGLAKFTQAYKDALFMEGEIERNDEPTVVSTQFFRACKLCEGLLKMEGGHMLLSDPPQFKYTCRECNDVTYDIV
jgi:hypothetical protein